MLQEISKSEVNIGRARPKGIGKPPPSEFIVITPDIATAWLERNSDNRKLSAGVVNQYARDITNSAWKLTGDPIRFDSNGVLIDGQHRLAACVKADRAFTTLVVYNIDPSAKWTLDTGKPRRPHDVLQMQGHNYAHLLTSTTRILVGLREKSANPWYLRATTSEILAFLEKHKSLPKSVALTWRTVGPRPSMVGAIHYVGANLLGVKERADAWAEVFVSGKPDYKNDPAHACREKLLRALKDETFFSRGKQFSLLMHVWNAFAQKKVLGNLKVPKDVEIEGLDPSKL